MNGVPFRHIGGMVIADHGPLTLATARRLSEFYDRESKHWLELEEAAAWQDCRLRSAALRAALVAAANWRRAAGWADPEAADA